MATSRIEDGQSKRFYSPVLAAFLGLTYGTDYPLFQVPIYGSGFPLGESENGRKGLIFTLRIAPHPYYTHLFKKNQPQDIGKIFSFNVITQYLVKGTSLIVKT